MNAPLWAEELAARFWEEVGEAEPFPRRLQRSILRALDLSIVLLPQLRLYQVLEWLRRREILFPLSEADRPLRACLICRRGAGFIFLDGADDEAEQRFSLAHELAHFLRDYWRPRRLAADRLGGQSLEVFDGLRPPRPEERLHSLLRNAPLGFHFHLMRRDSEGRLDPVTADAEACADRLAWELLAPATAALAGQENSGRQSLAARLRDVFGLPASQALIYADALRPLSPTDSFILRLKHFQ